MMEALAANRCMIPLLVPVLDRGDVSMTTIQYTAFGNVLRALATAIRAMTPAALVAHGMAMKQSPARRNDTDANQLPATTRLPVMQSIPSATLPLTTTPNHNP